METNWSNQKHVQLSETSLNTERVSVWVFAVISAGPSDQSMEPEATVLPEVSEDTNEEECPAEEPPEEEPKVHLQEYKGANECDSEDQKDKNTETKDLLKATQNDKKSIKEDFSQFTAEVLKVFREKDTNPSNQADNKPSISVAQLLKEDFSLLKEDMSSIFSSKQTPSVMALVKEDLSQFKEEMSSVFGASKDPKTSQSADKTINRFLSFKGDLSNVFRIGLQKEVAAKEEPSNIFKGKAKRTDEPFLQSLFKRDQKTSQNASQEVRKMFIEMTTEPMDAGFRGNLSENEETVITQKTSDDTKDEFDDSEVDNITSNEMMTSFSQSEQTEETSPAEQELNESSAEDDNKEEEEKEEQHKEEEEDKENEEEEVDETLPGEPLIDIFGLRKKSDTRDQPGGDVWSVKNYAHYLTFDPNTANSELYLSDGNRKATREWPNICPLDHPDRFESCPQVLCREGLLDPVYWEVEWSGGADIGVTYNNISRDGDTASCLLGHNERSWSLECSEGNYTPCHGNKRFRSSSPRPFTHRVGVYLDWSAGSLSFYCVSKENMVHLHTFRSTFTEPLYPGFWIWAYEGSVLLCQVELDWERLLK